MTVVMNVEDSTLTIEDMGVTVRTLLAHAAVGYALSQKRKWSVKYKGAIIGSFQVRTKNKQPLIPVKPVKLTQKQFTLRNMGVPVAPSAVFATAQSTLDGVPVADLQQPTTK